MKKLIILSTAFMFFCCTVNKKPEFIGVENIKVLESTSKYITITAEALFVNPNDVGGEIQTDEIKIFVNDNEMSTVSTELFEVPAKKEFLIPLKAKFPTDSLFSNKSIDRLIESLFSKKIKVQYKGDIKYKVLGFSSTYAVDQTEYIKIKL